MNKLIQFQWYAYTPLKQALDIAVQVNAPMAEYFNSMIALGNVDPVHQEVAEQRIRIATLDATRSTTYRVLNPTLSVHPIYHQTTLYHNNIGSN